MRTIARAARRAGLALVALLGLAGCQPARVVNALLDDDHYTVSRDIAYGDDPRQRLDLYEPRGEMREPLVVFVYGGNWREGDKDTYRFVGHALTALGYRVAIPDYRLYPAVTWPAFVDDVARAVARLIAADGAAATAPVILMGHSAGAHTAALLATDPRYFAQAGIAPRLAAFIGLAGPYELPFTDNTRPVFAPLEAPVPVQPIALELARMPRTLLLHGAADERVVPRHSRRFAEELEAAGVPVHLATYDDVGHVALVAGLAANLRWVAPTFGDVERFLLDGAAIVR